MAERTDTGQTVRPGPALLTPCVLSVPEASGPLVLTAPAAAPRVTGTEGIGCE